MRKVRRGSANAALLKKRRKNVVMFVAVSAVIVFILALGCLYVAAEGDSDRILRNVYVDGIRVGGMKMSEAREVLEDEFDKRRITVVVDADNKKRFTLDELGLTYKTDVIVSEAYDIGKSKSFVKNVYNIFRSFFIPKRLSSSGALASLGGEDVPAALAQYIDGFSSQPTESSYEITEDKVIVTNGANGREIDAGKLISDIVNARSFKDIEAIQAPVNIVPFTLLDVDEIYQSTASNPHAPYGRDADGRVTATVKVFDAAAAKDIQSAHTGEGERYEFDINGESQMPLADEALYPDVIGEETTKFDAGYTSRANNIRLASSTMDGAELLPGETFSFNSCVGPRTEEKGYQEAKSYADGTVTVSVGGGVCQVSSTLYNAVLRANLEIAARSNHSLPVAYLPMGQDAAVSYPSQDFKFKNNSDAPVKIKAEVSGGSLTVSIIGQKSGSFTDIKIINNTLSVISPKSKEVIDDSLDPGERVVKQSGSNGYIVESFRVVYKDGVEIKRENLGKSTYKAQDKIINVGPSTREGG